MALTTKRKKIFKEFIARESSVTEARRMFKEAIALQALRGVESKAKKKKKK